MKTLLAVARREIVEKRFVLAAAGVAAVIPLLIPIVRQLPGDGASIARQMTALILATTLGAGLSVALGVTLFTSELVSHRMSFYFSKPISGMSLWVGKLVGAVVLIGAGFAIPLLPTIVLDGGMPVLQIPGESWKALAFAVAALVVGMVLVNALAITIRSRSWLALVDLMAAAAVVFAAFALFARMVPVWIVLFREVRPMLLLAVLAAFVGLVVLLGSYRALASGRSDIRTAHRRHFETVWSLFGSAIMATFLYSCWALSAPPQSIYLGPPRIAGPSGWVWLDGVGRGAWNSFLYDTKSGRSQRTTAWRSRANATSADGSVAAWDEVSAVSQLSRLIPFAWSGRFASVLYVLRLDRPDAPVELSRIGFSPYLTTMLLSPDGTTVAGVEGNQVTVFDLKSERLRGVFRLADEQGFEDAWFDTSDSIRILRWQGWGVHSVLNAFEIDLRRRSLWKTGTVTLGQSDYGIARSFAGDRLLVHDKTAGAIRLLDARTLSLLSTTPIAGEHLNYTLLSKGGYLVLSGDKNAWWAEVFSETGGLEARISLGAARNLQIGVETANGRFPIAVTDARTDETRLMEIDPEARTVRLLTTGLNPVVADRQWFNRDLLPPGCEAGKLFLAPNGAFVRFDPQTGEQRVILTSHGKGLRW